MDVSALVENTSKGNVAARNDTPQRKRAQASGKSDAAVPSADDSKTTDAQTEESSDTEAKQSGAAAAPSTEDSDKDAAKDDSEGKAGGGSPNTAATPEKRAEEQPEGEENAQNDETPQPKPIKRAAAGSVGKAGVKAQSTPAKRTPVAKMPSATKVSSNSKKFDVIHAKQIAKEPTIYEHDKAKKAKAGVLLQVQSVTRPTRSSARKAVRAKEEAAADAASKPSVAKKIVFRASRSHVSVLDRPTISSSLKQAATKEKAAPARKASQPKPFTSTVTAGAKKSVAVAAPGAKASASAAKTAADAKRPLSYKPYTGPLPKYKEDPKYSPLSMSKSAASEYAKAKVSAHTPAKKGKENAKPPTATTTPAKSTAGRTPIKKASASAALASKAKDDRRAKFAQDTKTKATAARQSPRRVAAKAQ